MPGLDAATRGEDALRKLIDELDPRSPMACSLWLAAERIGLPIGPNDGEVDANAIFDFWEKRAPGSLVSDARYRWELTHARAPGASYDVPFEEWVPWRPQDARVMSRDGADFELRLTLPISIADGCELLARWADRDERAARFLEESEPVFRKDLAGFVHAAHAWKDGFALYCLSRRAHALERMQPFAIAIAACYTPEAKQVGWVAGRRFPFHDKALVSASAMLGSGLLALGHDVRVVAELSKFVRDSQRDGAWGDDEGPNDVLTTMLAAELLGQIDPSFDVEQTVGFLAKAQRRDGTWRVLGPEVPWLTDAVTAWLRDAALPFASRFRFPHLPASKRDQKTKLPYYAYFTDLVRLFGEIPGLSSSSVCMAFMDLAGFRAFNNQYGQDLGDAVLAAFADELASISDSVTIRDGGDEFLVLGAPTGTELPQSIRAFRERWPKRFVEQFGAEAPPVTARVLLATTDGDRLREARERLGREVGALKHEEAELGRVGLTKDLGRL